VKAVAAGQEGYINLQACIIPLLLLNWGLFSHQTPAFQFLTKPLALLALPLAELAIVIMTVGLLLGMAIHVLLGERVEHWSSLASMAQRIVEHVLVGTFSSAILGITLLMVASFPWNQVLNGRQRHMHALIHWTTLTRMWVCRSLSRPSVKFPSLRS
jgi:hypothetical protein